MSTHDYNLANQSGASFRSDLNNCLAAILSNNSNGSAPSTTVAYSIWADTTAGKLKIRNSSNDGFVDLINLDGTIQRDVSLTGDLTLTDKIIHSGDTNTAIRFPATDTFSVETAGSESFRIDSSQRLLLGTTTARAVGGETNPVLHIEGSGNTSNSWVNLTRFQAGTGSANFQFAKARSDTPGTYTVVQDGDNLGQISFLGADGTDMANYAATIKAQVDGTPGSNDMPGRLIFSTTADGASSVTERMRIDSSGNLGIGTTSPSVKLQVQGNVQFGDGGGFDMNINGTRHQFSIGGSEKMRLTSNGDLGIGTSSPDGRLHCVTGAANDNAHFTLHASATSGTDNNGPVLKVISSRGTGNFHKIFDVLTNTSTSVLSATGDQQVTVNGDFFVTDATPSISLYDNQATNRFAFIDGNGGSMALHADKGNTGSSSTLKLAVDNSVKMTVDDSGNIGAPSGSNIYNASDSRLKKNVINLDKGLAAINSLRPVSFNWIDGFCDEEKETLYGFIAQEVQALDTNLIQSFSSEVNLEDDAENPTIFKDVLRVNEKFIIPILVKAIQELSAKVTALEAL